VIVEVLLLFVVVVVVVVARLLLHLHVRAAAAAADRVQHEADHCLPALPQQARCFARIRGINHRVRTRCVFHGRQQGVCSAKLKPTSDDR